MRTTRTFITSVALIATLGLSACGGGETDADADSEPRATTTVADPTTTTTEADDAFEAALPGTVANAGADLAVYADPADADPAQVLPAKTEFGSRRVLSVVSWQGPEGEWLEVSLPVRPNGARGFVRLADVTLSTVDVRIDVDLAARRLQLLDRDGNVLIDTPAAIGSEENPTPTGDFYLTDILITGDDGSSYGPIAYGLSGHSLSLSDFAGGDGQIGIHGTNQPSSIGQAVSHGCVRVPNEIATALGDAIALGTPVSIH